jgi:hypothetical protein
VGCRALFILTRLWRPPWQAPFVVLGSRRQCLAACCPAQEGTATSAYMWGTDTRQLPQPLWLGLGAAASCWQASKARTYVNGMKCNTAFGGCAEQLYHHKVTIHLCAACARRATRSVVWKLYLCGCPRSLLADSPPLGGPAVPWTPGCLSSPLPRCTCIRRKLGVCAGRLCGLLLGLCLRLCGSGQARCAKPWRQG